MTDDDGPTDGLDREGFTRRFRGLDPATRRAFVADLWRAAGWAATVEGEVVTVTREAPSRETERLFVRASPGDSVPSGVDTVITAESSGADAGPADTAVVSPDQLYRRARYGLDRPAADRLFGTYFGRPMGRAFRDADGPARDASGADADRDPDPGPPADASAGAVGGVDAGSTRRLLLAAAAGATVALLAVATVTWAGGAIPAATPTPTSTSTPTTDRPAATELGAAGNLSLDDRYARFRPTCERPPGVVVAIQLAALRINDPRTNQGIRTVWRFAAPSNRRATGPFSNFVRIVTSDTYAPLVNHERALLGPVDLLGTSSGEAGGAETAIRTVVVYDANGTASAFEFRLSKQEGGEYDGCWMTESVLAMALNETGFPVGSPDR